MDLCKNLMNLAAHLGWNECCTFEMALKFLLPITNMMSYPISWKILETLSSVM